MEAPVNTIAGGTGNAHTISETTNEDGTAHPPYGSSLPRLVPATEILVGNFGPTGVSNSGLSVFWQNAPNADIRRSLVSNLSASPVALSQSLSVNVPDGGNVTGWHNIWCSKVAGIALACAIIDTGRYFMYRITNLDAVNPADVVVGPNPVHWFGAVGADGVSGTHFTGFRPLSAPSYTDAIVDGVPAILYLDYSAGASDAHRYLWMSKDVGLTWSILRTCQTTVQHREHGHSITQLSNGDLIEMWGDAFSNPAGPAIIRGPSDSIKQAAMGAASNATIAADVSGDWAILHGNEQYRVITGVEKDGFLYYGLDSGGNWGIYRLPITFNTGDDHALVFDGGAGYFAANRVRHGGAILTDQGTIIIPDWLESGGAPFGSDVSEIRLNASVNGTTWGSVATILQDSKAIPPGSASCTDVFQLPDGRIIFGLSGHRFRNRSGPPEDLTPNIYGAKETAMVIEQGVWDSSSGPEVVVPRAWV